MCEIVIGVHIGHNASAAFVTNGNLSFALQEERLTRIKNQGGLPQGTLSEINSHLSTFPTRVEQVPVIFGGRNLTACPWRREETLKSYAHSSAGLVGGLKRLARKSSTLSNLVNQIKIDGLERKVKAAIDSPRVQAHGIDHHMCHAASAYFGWGRLDEKILVLTCDGAGDCLCATVNIGDRGELYRVAQVDESHSIGALYAKITYLCGMIPMEHEYKLMGLAPYAERASNGKQIAADLEQMFEFEKHNPMCWRRRNGCPPIQFAAGYLERRLRLRRFDHIAAGAQLFIENFLARWVQSCIRETGIRNVALSGGVFMNVKANKKILELPEVEELFVFPSCGDETNAIGAAWLHYRSAFGKPPAALKHLYLGTDCDGGEADEALRRFAFSTSVSVREHKDIESEVAELLARGEIVARMKGRCEFGARALGNRSILANAGCFGTVRTINEMIKCRDFWMPFAPSVLAERSDLYFLKPKPMDAPHMIMTFDTREEKRARIAAAIHPYDQTGRPQEVSERTNPDYYRLLRYFEDRTGEGLILNTSFNLHGEPVVCSAQDALRVFDRSGLRHLALDNFLISKN